MSEIPKNVIKELDKLVNIANTYREGTMSESLLIDVIFPLSNELKGISLYKEYLSERGVSITKEEEIEGISDETGGSELVKPYDTSRIDISPKPLTLDMLIARLENDEIDLMPDFQRKSGLWSERQKSQLIESLILRIPLPAFYFDGSYNDKWVVIDGLQRLTAFKEFFVDKELSLSGLEFLKDLEGTKIDDMPRSYLRRMKETQIISYIINPGAPINLKFNIFKRINTGGLELAPQEIRHALYQGIATEYLKELASCEEFKKATGYSVQTDRMLDREFILRFITFYELGVSEYKGSIDLFLNNGMDYINKYYNETYAQKMKQVFQLTMRTSMDIFDKFAFRRMVDEGKRRPISKALFETWTCILAHHSKDDLQILVASKLALIDKYITMCRDDKDFVEAIGSGKIYSVKKRFEKIENLVKEILNK